VYRVAKKSQSLHFSCTLCIVATLTNCETSRGVFSSSLQTFLLSLKFFVTFSVFELFSKNWFGATNFRISWNCGLKFEHPVTRLFLGVQGGSTTQINRLELVFTVVLSKKFYLKNCVQGDQKQLITILFMHTLYTGSKNSPANLQCCVKKLIKVIFGLFEIFRNFPRFWVI